MTSPATGSTRTAEQVVELDVDDVVFRSADGRFAVVRGTARNDDEMVVVGDLGAVSPGETLRVRGRWTRHAVYGRRFEAASFTPVTPTSRNGVVRYLGSGLVPGVGPALAERLVERFGERTLDVITTESARLREVDGIGPRRAQAIAEAVRERQAEVESMSYLQSLGLGRAMASRILRRYGDDAARVVREDPYLVAEHVRGIGFRTADRIGRAAGIAADDPRRAAGAVLHLVGKASDDGHVYALREELRQGARELGVPEERIDAAIDTLVEREMLVREDEAVYAPPLYEAENDVADAVARLTRPRQTPRDADRVVRQAADGSLSETQRGAVRASLEGGLLVLTGGPGTGKTTTVRAIVEAHRALGHRVVLCAPTGRAAKRLSEATRFEARTIHRTLEWNPKTGGFGRDADDPLDAELVLVDEASMMDLPLARSLLSAVASSARLVLVGDVDQLPPVGPGQVLRDVIDSGAASVVRLTEVFRQAQRSAIVRGAHSILAGEVPTPTPTGDKGSGDLFVVRAREPAAAHDLLVQSLRRMPEAYGLDPRRDVQVLTPMRRGPLGTEQLNALLQAELNPAPDGAQAAAGTLRPGDKVMQLRNDYDREVFNGDVGEVRRVEGGITYVTIDGREVQYGTDDLDALTLAYATTVHKVQGGEFPAVVVVLHASHWVLLSRALLYTAVTRGKRLVVLLGDPRAMSRAAKNAFSYDIHSRLLERIRDRAQG